MISRNQILEEARSYVGTPYHHQGRLKGVGLDCSGLIVCVAKSLGLFESTIVNYSKRQEYFTNILMVEIKKYMIEIDVDDACPGDVLVFWMNARTKTPAHLAIKTERGIIQTFDDANKKLNKVVDTTLSPSWHRRITNVFKFQGVTKWQH